MLRSNTRRALASIALLCALLTLVSSVFAGPGRGRGRGAPFSVLAGTSITFDFTTYAPGVISLPAGLALTRAASSAGTDPFQTSVSSFATASANQARVSWSSYGTGLLVETTATNAVSSTTTMAGSAWATGIATIVTGAPDPAGGTTGLHITGTSSQYSSYWSGTGQNGAWSLWYRQPGASATTIEGRWVNNVLTYGYQTAATATWQQLTWNSVSGVSPIWVVVDGRGVVPGQTPSAVDVDVAYLFSAARPYLPSPVISPSGVMGTRAADIFEDTAPAALVDSTGRLALAATLYLEGAVAQLPSPPTIWYVDANNNAVVTSSGTVAVTVGGTTFTTSLQLNAGPGRLDIYVAAGGGSQLTEVWISTDGGITGQQLGISATPQGAIGTSSPIYLFSGPSTSQWDAQIATIKASFRPSYANADSWVGAPILDLDLSSVPAGTPYDLTAPQLAALTTNGSRDLVLEIRFTPTTDLLATGNTHLEVFDATTTLGDLSAFYRAQDNGQQPDSWAQTLVSGGTTLGGVACQSNSSNTSPGTPEGASPLVGDDARVYASYLAAEGTWSLGPLWVNGVVGGSSSASLATIAPIGTPIGPITALRIGAKLDGTLVLPAQLTHLRAYRNSGAVEQGLPIGLWLGDSTTAQFDIAWGYGGTHTRIYTPSESSAFITPRIAQLAEPGSSNSDQLARYNASPWKQQGSIKWAYIQAVNVDAINGLTAAQIASAQNTLIAALRADHPGIVIVCGVSFPNKGYQPMTAPDWTQVLAFNALLIAGGTVNSDVVVSGYYAGMGDPSGKGPDYLNPNFDGPIGSPGTGDGGHPNGLGREYEAGYVRAALQAHGLF